jgi:hypothetical protein
VGRLFWQKGENDSWFVDFSHRNARFEISVGKYFWEDSKTDPFRENYSHRNQK